jgi:predicted nuclease of predicted toxin-antitoxin system
VRFKLDENMPVEAAELLTRDGHDAVTVLDQKLNGAGDPDVAAACREEGRVLVTLDVDFGDIRSYPPRECPGIVVLRLRSQAKL